jgi:phage terminase small subunit
MALTPRQAAFVQEYLIDLNATQAATRAGYSGATANEQGARLLANASVAAAIEMGQKARAERTEITADLVLRRWWQVVEADANALIQHRIAPCRYCYGDGFLYQWKTVREFEAAVRAIKEGDPIPDDRGGYGYRHDRDPNPECPECFGEGTGYALAADTRLLTADAKILYAGVKVTRDGLEVKMHDQAKALENVARHLGMFKDKIEHTGPDGAPLMPSLTVTIAKE